MSVLIWCSGFEIAAPRSFIVLLIIVSWLRTIGSLLKHIVWFFVN